MGHIYEKYLGEKVYIEGDKIRLDKTPEARKSGGVYYTPSYINQYIVDNTLGAMLTLFLSQKIGCKKARNIGA